MFSRIFSRIAVLFLWVPLVCQALTTFQFSDGSSVTGELIQERPDRIIVDLGFTVLTIPRDVVVEVEEALAGRAGTTEYNEGGLYSVANSPQPMAVKDWVDTIGEAVVLIRTKTGLGSGFVIHEAGYVVTNDHVIAGEHEIAITVFERDSGSLERVQFQNVRIIASSPEMDLALLKIEAKEQRLFETVPIGESDYLRQGQSVFAIGSPLGLDRSVSQGIISIKNRPISGRIYIQTTTEINPGNSGGPLFNLKGEVVGVNNMKIVAMGAEGLGFAIPANVLKMFLHNRDAFAFDPRNPNVGFRYNEPPSNRHIKKSE